MRKLFGVIALVGLAAVPAAAQAQQVKPFNIGVQGSYGSDSDFGVGVRYENSLNRLFPSMPLRFIGSFDWFFPDEGGFGGVDVTYFEINANVAYAIPMANSPLRPYAGGGLNYARASVEVGGTDVSDSQVGLNLLGGIRFGGKLSPFVEGRFELSGGEQFVISGGILF